MRPRWMFHSQFQISFKDPYHMTQVAGLVVSSNILHGNPHSGRLISHCGAFLLVSCCKCCTGLLYRVVQISSTDPYGADSPVRSKTDLPTASILATIPARQPTSRAWYSHFLMFLAVFSAVLPSFGAPHSLDDKYFLSLRKIGVYLWRIAVSKASS